MTHYYDARPFTKAQASHASIAVLKLMQERRFFLYEHDEHRSSEKDPDYTLDPAVFADALKLDKDVRAAYTGARQAAETSILEAEKGLGVRLHGLSGNKQLVQVNRYTGGFDICRVYPFTAFAQYAPSSLGVLSEQIFKQHLDGKSEDDIAPKVTRVCRDRAGEHAGIIWKQLEVLDARNPENHRCVVMMQSRFSCESGDDNHDFAHGKVWDMQEFSHAMGYLFHSYSMQTRIVRHSHVVFSTSRKSHVNVQHWNGEKEPTINYDFSDGYSCPVQFVTVI